MISAILSYILINSCSYLILCAFSRISIALLVFSNLISLLIILSAIISFISLESIISSNFNFTCFPLDNSSTTSSFPLKTASINFSFNNDDILESSKNNLIKLFLNSVVISILKPFSLSAPSLNIFSIFSIFASPSKFLNKESSMYLAATTSPFSIRLLSSFFIELINASSLSPVFLAISNITSLYKFSLVGTASNSFVSILVSPSLAFNSDKCFSVSISFNSFVSILVSPSLAFNSDKRFSVSIFINASISRVVSISLIFDFAIFLISTSSRYFVNSRNIFRSPASFSFIFNIYALINSTFKDVTSKPNSWANPLSVISLPSNLITPSLSKTESLSLPKISKSSCTWKSFTFMSNFLANICISNPSIFISPLRKLNISPLKSLNPSNNLPSNNLVLNTSSLRLFISFTSNFKPNSLAKLMISDSFRSFILANSINFVFNASNLTIFISSGFKSKPNFSAKVLISSSISFKSFILANSINFIFNASNLTIFISSGFKSKPNFSAKAMISDSFRSFILANSINFTFNTSNLRASISFGFSFKSSKSLAISFISTSLKSLILHISSNFILSASILRVFSSVGFNFIPN